MTLRHLKIFVTVFHYSNVTKAAKELCLAQPSVSVAIKELENYYGVRLFERTGRHITPTKCGEELFGYASHIVSSCEDMEKRIQNWDTKGVLRVGASITIGTYILPGLVKKYQKLFPDLKILVKICQSAMIEHQIMNNNIDIGLIEAQPEHPEIVSCPFMKDNLCAIVAIDHPLVAFEKISVEQMAEYPFLMREKGSAGREMLEAYFAVKGIKIQPLWESTSTQALVKGVAAGLGVAVLPYLLVEKDVEERAVAMIPFQKPMERNFNMIYHKSKYLTNNMKLFMELCNKRE